MTFSTKEKQDGQAGTEQGLLDASLMQNLQDRFCDANHVYLVCLNKNRGIVTKAYGSKEELDYIQGIVNRERHDELLKKLVDSSIESVIEEDCGRDDVKLCGVSIRVGGETEAIWIVTGVLEQEGSSVPEYIMRTTPERYYKSLEFLETLSKQMFAVKMEELMAQEAFLKSRESEAQMETELHRNETMTAIVKMLESEESFEQVVNHILKVTCDYLGISDGALLRENKDGVTVDVICRYGATVAEPGTGLFRENKKEKLPFFNGKPYMISSDSMMTEEFQHLFEAEGIRAAMFLPVDVNGHTGMYLCLCETAGKHVWDGAEIKFVSDVKRIIQSILHKRVAKNSLASSYASLEAILENIGCAVYVVDPVEKTTFYTNQRFKKTFQKGLAQIELELEKENPGEKETCFREIYRKEENRWYDLHSTRIDWVDGRKVLLCTIYDITDKKLYQQKIERQANNDFLTGLYNRMRCEQDLQRYIEQTKEFNGEGALFYIDLDDFKHINDGLGHQYGDVLLKEISNSLKKIPGVENNCYRMGGDEFIIILSYLHISMLDQILDEIKTLFTKPWMLKGADYYCTMSMGVVRFPTNGDTVEELIKKADIALYVAKCAGKNRIEFYEENVEAGEKSYKRLDLEKNMRNATQNSCREFEVYFQPIVDVTKPGNPCAGAEALIRWNSGEMGLIPPTDFIPLAEYLGLINPIGEYVLREACKRCKYWNDMGHPDYKVNVNLSVVQLLQNDVVERIYGVLQETGIAPKNLTLEVTESLAINDMSRMKRILAEIRRLGVRVALDDFGTGYSSLNHIREMPIDVIKIDRCFIIDIGRDDFSSAFVKMVAELASAIQVKVCVEGVETEEQIKILKESKIQLIQGYYFGKPMRAEIFEKQYL